jgi:opacity protein-like surface antigen
MIVRKQLFLFVFFATSVFCSAQITGNLEFYSGISLFHETSRLNGQNTIYESVSVPVGISGGIYFNDFIGIKAYLDFLFPVSYTARPDDGITAHREDYDFLLGMDELFGVVINVVKTERLTIPFVAGFHGKLFFSTISDHFTMSANSGIGIGIGTEYAFTDKVYFLTRINGSFDFLGLSLMTPTGNAPAGEQTKFDVAFIHTWGFSPHIGIGIKL